MNSPSVALVWEIWRKNRRGFVGLILILLSCAGLSQYVRHLKAWANIVESTPENLFGRPLAPGFLLPMSPTGLFSQKIQLKIDARLVHEGIIKPEDVISWSGATGKVGWIRMTLNGTNIFQGPIPNNARLNWTGERGNAGHVRLTLDRGNSEDIPFVLATVENWREAVLIWSVLMMGFSVLVVFGIFGCAEPSTQRGFTGIPPRKFTLPLPTREFVMWPMTLGAASVFVLYFAWRWLVLPEVLPPAVTVPDVYLSTLLLAGLAAFQAVVWGLPSFPKTRVCFLSVLVLGLICLAALPFIARLDVVADGEWKLSPLEIKTVPVFALVWVFSRWAAHAGVHAERHGGWFDPSRRFEVLDQLRGLMPRTFIQFVSAFHAQFWIEWRRNGRLAVTLWALLVAISVVVQIVVRIQMASEEGSQNFKQYSEALPPIMIIAAIAWAAISGLNLARDGSSKRLALSSFTATRPVETGSLLAAKLLAGILIWVFGVAILGVGFLAAVLAGGIPNNWPGFGSTAYVLAISLNIFIGILPLCLSGKIPGFPWSLLPLLLVYGLIMNIMIWFERHQAYHDWIFILIAWAVFIKLVIAFCGFWIGIKEKIISSSFVAISVLAWLVVTATLVAVALGALIVDRAPDAGWLIPCAAFIVPIARIAISPLALAKNRHR